MQLKKSDLLRIGAPLFILLVQFKTIESLLDPLSIGIGIGTCFTLGVYKSWNFITRNSVCRFQECCDENSIPADIDALRESLRSKLYGQHIVIDKVVSALAAHLNSRVEPRKPLVMSFHGTPGTGKNFVTEQIAKALYKNGLQSQYVYKYSGRADFPVETKTDIYKERINDDVRNAISKCERSLFIFDEVDKMPPGVFESLTSLVDYNAMVNKKTYGKAIFLFLSNTAGVNIANHLAVLINKGLLREETNLSDFEKILEQQSYNLQGGLKKTSLIEAHVIDHFLPFLPLEKRHVYKCIEAAFLNWGINPKEDEIEFILTEYVTYEKIHNIFATSGCKTIEKKVAVHAMQNE